MTTSLTAGLALALLSVAGCASAADDRERAGPLPGAQPALPVVAAADPVRPRDVIAKLRFRDVDLVITGARAGPRFAVVTRGGVPLATNLEEADLRKHHPDLYSAYRFGHARGPFLDARLDLPREKPRSPHGF